MAVVVDVVVAVVVVVVVVAAAYWGLVDVSKDVRNTFHKDYIGIIFPHSLLATTNVVEVSAAVRDLRHNQAISTSCQ